MQLLRKNQKVLFFSVVLLEQIEKKHHVDLCVSNLFLFMINHD